MKNLIFCLIFALFFSACEVRLSTPEHDSGIGVSYTYVEYVCEDPYWYEPDWCDYYSDGETCCSWWVYNRYEEWCQWDHDWCWEYNGSF
jgi:hypothetical protein